MNHRTNQRLKNYSVGLLALISMGAFSACDSSGMGSENPLESTMQSDLAGNLDGANSIGKNPNGSNVIGESCASNNPDQICLAVQYVSYTDSSGKAVTSEQLAIDNIRVINDIWKQCGIAFQIEKYAAVNPKDQGLAYGAEAQSQTDEIRRTYKDKDDRTLLLVSTGAWPGSTKNAWATMPGDAPYGAVFEAGVADYPQIIGHELGHYLNLDHESINENLMSSVIYKDSTVLSDSQCAISQEASRTAWANMMR